MKKLFFLSILLTLSHIQAQITVPPQGINYQAVAVDAKGKEIVGVDMKGQPLAEKAIRVRFSILKDAANGTLAYREEHTTNTDANGLFNLVIGQGAPDTGLFENIDWGTGFHFLKVEMDVTGGSQYTHMGTQQLWSVPYALYTKTAGNGVSSVSDNGDGTLTFTYVDGSTYTTSPLTGLTGPQGPAGIQGPQGVAGANGQDGATGPAGAQGPQGIQGPAGVNGTNGVDGKNTLTKTTTEAAGANCTTGGVKIEYGLDANNNGTLDVSEINATLTKYVCNGAQGTPGSQNAWSLTGNAGTNPTTNFIGTTDAKDFVVKTNNIEKMRVTSSGNVGIGTSSPQSRLVINSDSGVGSGVDSSIVFTNIGNVGIGNSSPLYKLDIGTSDNFNWAQRIRNTGGSGYGLLVQSGSLTSNIPTFQVQNNYNSKLFTINSTGLIGIGTEQPVSLLNLKYSPGTGGITLSDEADLQRARLYVEGDSSTSITNLRIDVNTKTNTSDAQIRIFRSTNTTGSKFVSFLRGNGTTEGSARIGVDGVSSYFQLQGGNFGIGNNTPLDKLHISGGGIRIDGSYGVGFNSCPPYDTTLNEGARIYWKEIPSFGPQKDYFVFEKTDANQSDPDGGFLFVNTGNDNVKSYAMMINGNGNIGLNTTTPARTLHVNAVMRLEPIPTTSAPSSPAKGDMYFDSTINKLRVYDGTTWQNCW